MTTTAENDRRRVTVGVDAHADVHVAAVLDDATGKLLETRSVPTTPKGYADLLAWARSWGVVGCVGVEDTGGAYGAGLARHLAARGVAVVEVDRPDRRARRARGKSDTVDAEAAARAALAGTARGTPEARDGAAEAVRALRVARRSAVKARSQAAHQLHASVLTAPDAVRARLRDLRPAGLVEAAAALRPGDPATAAGAAQFALRRLARRHQALSAEVAELDAVLGPLVAAAAPGLVALNGVGTDVAGALLVAAGDDPGRLASEAAFAHLCGAAPLPASSGKTQRHRLDRGGDRQANAALCRIVLCRLRWHAATRTYAERRTKEGLSKPEVIHCSKRYVAREVYRELSRLGA